MGCVCTLQELPDHSQPFACGYFRHLARHSALLDAVTLWSPSFWSWHAMFKHHPRPGHWFPSILQDLVSLLLPEHADPPLEGAGFVQVRVLFATPSPQNFEHFPYLPQGVHFPFTGQFLTLQDAVCLELPEHDVPPFKGAGLLHWRVLVFVPSPQVLEQVLHVELHWPHCPLTAGCGGKTFACRKHVLYVDDADTRFIFCSHQQPPFPLE